MLYLLRFYFPLFSHFQLVSLAHTQIQINLSHGPKSMQWNFAALPTASLPPPPHALHPYAAKQTRPRPRPTDTHARTEQNVAYSNNNKISL